MTEQGQLSFQRNDDSTLLVRLSGAWRLQGGLPSASLIDSELQSAAQVSGIIFDAKELTSWDSSVLTFLVELSDLCRRHGVGMDRTGLPAGVRRLLDLAEAVPEKRAHAKRSLKLRSSGASAIVPSAPANL
jgi:phospholipid/cholesterol/gamma-HCH transport system permease protein